MIKSVSDLRHVGGFYGVLRFPLDTNKSDRHDVNEILLKVALSTIPIELTFFLISDVYINGWMKILYSVLFFNSRIHWFY